MMQTCIPMRIRVPSAKAPATQSSGRARASIRFEDSARTTDVRSEEDNTATNYYYDEYYPTWRRLHNTCTLTGVKVSAGPSHQSSVSPNRRVTAARCFSSGWCSSSPLSASHVLIATPAPGGTPRLTAAGPATPVLAVRWLPFAAAADASQVPCARDKRLQFRVAEECSANSQATFSKSCANFSPFFRFPQEEDSGRRRDHTRLRAP